MKNFMEENNERIDLDTIIDQPEIEYCSHLVEPDNWYTAELTDGRKAYWYFEDMDSDPDDYDGWEVPTFIEEK